MLCADDSNPLLGGLALIDATTLKSTIPSMDSRLKSWLNSCPLGTSSFGGGVGGTLLDFFLPFSRLLLFMAGGITSVGVDDVADVDGDIPMNKPAYF